MPKGRGYSGGKNQRQQLEDLDKEVEKDRLKPSPKSGPAPESSPKKGIIDSIKEKITGKKSSGRNDRQRRGSRR